MRSVSAHWNSPLRGSISAQGMRVFCQPDPMAVALRSCAAVVLGAAQMNIFTPYSGLDARYGILGRGPLGMGTGCRRAAKISWLVTVVPAGRHCSSLLR